MILIYLLLFTAAVIFSFYVPGKLLIEFLKLEFSPFEKTVYATVSGLALFLLGTYIFSWIHAPFIYLFLLIIINIYGIYISYKSGLTLNFNLLEKIDRWAVLIIIAGALCFSFIMFFSGYVFSDGIKFMFVNGTDGIRHIAYIKNEIFNFPPQQVSLAGVPLKGFHYFYDFMLAKFVQFYGFTVMDLYFRLFPLFLSLFYGFSFYILAKRITQNLTSQRLILFFSYFAASFSVLAFLFTRSIGTFDTGTVHPIGLMVNPFTVLSIIMLVLGLTVLPDLKKSFKYALILGLIFGVLSEIKVYAGIMAIVTISFYSLYIFLRYKRKYYVSYFTLLAETAILTAVTFLPNNLGQGGLVFAPFLFYRQYMETDIFSFLNWETKFRINLETGNFIKNEILLIEAAVIYWIYNLGILSIMLLGIKKIFKKKFWTNDYNLILFLTLFTAIFIVSYFVQTVSVYDTVQFLWISFPIIGIPAAIVLGDIVLKNKNLGKFILALVLLFSLPRTLYTLWEYMPTNAPTVATKSQIAFYQRIGKFIPISGFIVYIPSENYIQTGPKPTDLMQFYTIGSPVISALSGRSLYLGGGNLPNNLGDTYKARFKSLLSLENAIESCSIGQINRDLDRIGTKYVLSEKPLPCLATSSATLTLLASDTLKLYLLK